MKKILITGGFGFLGTHLVELLMKFEPYAAIHIVDNLSTNVMDHEDFLDSIGNPSNITWSIADVSEYLCSTKDTYNQIYHLASFVGPAGILKYSGKIAKAIIDDTNLVARAALHWGARLVNVSTSEVYGGGQSSEDDPQVIPAEVTVRLEYAIGKLAADISLINLHESDDLAVSIVRPFNIAGPRQSAEGGFVLPRFCQAALAGRPLTVFGDGSQVRGFTHVNDVADGLWRAMTFGGRSLGEVFNIGDEQNECTVKELAELVINRAKSKSRIEYVDPKTIYGPLYEEANDKLPDSRKARTELDWVALRSLDMIVEDCLQWERSR